MKKILSLLFILLSTSLFSQKLTCKDFKEGEFIVPKDSIVPFTYKIVRKSTSQIEYAININEIKDSNLRELPELKQKIHGIVKWISDCSYKLKYDTSKMKLNDGQQFINDHGGILVELKKIDRNCFYYKSTLTVNGKTQRVDGKQCKE